MTWVLTPIEETNASEERAVSAEAAGADARTPAATQMGRRRLVRISPSNRMVGVLAAERCEPCPAFAQPLEWRDGSRRVGSLGRMPSPVSGNNGTGNGVVPPPAAHDPF